MPRFAQGVDAHSGWIVHVNSDLIRTAAPDPSGGTILYFDDQHSMILKDKLEDFMRKIRDAERS